MNYQLPCFTALNIPGRQDLEGKLFNGGAGGNKKGIKTAQKLPNRDTPGRRDVIGMC